MPTKKAAKKPAPKKSAPKKKAAKKVVDEKREDHVVCSCGYNFAQKGRTECPNCGAQL